MFKNKILIFIILMIALLSIGVASATESSMNATDTVGLDDSTIEVVTSTYDENTSLDVVSEDNSQIQCENNIETSFDDELISSSDSPTQNNIVDSGETPKTFTQLNETINTANGTLTLDSNYKMTADEANTFKYGITISKNITIDGKGFTIDANNLGRIFNIVSGNVSLINVTLSNGERFGEADAAMAGAINNNGILNLINVIFVNNSAYTGAVIYNWGSGSVSDCIFVNNSASMYASAIYNFRDSSLTVANSVFVNNHATDGGGAIYNHYYSSVVVSGVCAGCGI